MLYKRILLFISLKKSKVLKKRLWEVFTNRFAISEFYVTIIGMFDLKKFYNA